MKPVSVNFHLWKPCNYRCQFCYETMPDIHSHLSLNDSLYLLKLLREAGTEKINFAGGEPTLCPYLGDLLSEARRLGFVTSIVTNGARLTQLLTRHASDIDWVGLSVDSADEETSKRLGRGFGDHVKRSIILFDALHEHKIRVKLNTVVTRLNYQEDMSAFIRRVSPERWKIFQVLLVKGQNNGSVEDLLISKAQFQEFVERHKHLNVEGYKIVAETNDLMRGSYVMIDPLGRFFSDAKGYHEYSLPILEVGVNAAFVQVDWYVEKFVDRGGIYDWR